MERNSGSLSERQRTRTWPCVQNGPLERRGLVPTGRELPGASRLDALRKTALLAIVCLAGNQVLAQSVVGPEPVPELIVTGTIIADEDVFDTVPRTSVTAEDIAALHPATVLDLLRSIPGVDVTQQGGEGGLTYVSMRGGDPNFTVVMIDGVKVADPTNTRGGGFDFSGLDPLMVERVDVYFGSYSAVYGSDALGGAINVTTRRAGDTFSGTGTLEVGTGQSRAGALSVSGRLTDSLGASVSLVAREGSDAVEGDSLERQQLALTFGSVGAAETGPSWDVNIFVSSADTTSFPIGSGGDRLAVIRAVEQRDFDQTIAGGRIEWSPTANWHAALKGGWTHYEEHNDSPGIAPGVLDGIPPVRTDSQYERANVSFSNTVVLSDPLVIGFGAELAREEGEIDSLIDFGFPLPAEFSLARDIWALFGEVAVAMGENASLVASLRHDDAEALSSTNARITASVDFDRTNTTASFTYAEGFKLPSMFALGHSLTGNPDLDPEHSESFSINLDQPFAGERAALSLSLYHNEYTELVDFDAETFSHVNRSSATAKGVDVAISVEPGERIRLNGSIGFLDANISDGTKLDHRPDWKGGLSLTWMPAEDWLIAIHGKVNGDFYSLAVPIGVTLLDGYSRIDTSIHWKLSEKIELKLLIDNVFDNYFEEVAGFSTAGRQARLAFSGRL